MAQYLQHGPRRLVIMAFRGIGKSWITAAFVVWTLLLDPQKKVLVVSASKDRADDFVTFTKALISLMPETHHLIPDADRKDQRDSRIAFDVGPARPSQSPSVKAKGITSTITGGRADLIIPDDIESPNNSYTQMMRDRLTTLVQEFDSILLPGGRIAYLGTPQTEDSLYFNLPSDRERGYQKRIWPARVPDAEMLEQYGDILAPKITLMSRELDVRTPTDPGRFDDTDLEERELSYGKSGFNMQFMLLPNLSDEERYPLKLRDLIAYDCDLEHAPARLVWGNGDQQRLKTVTCVGRKGDGIYGPVPHLDETGEAIRMMPYSGRLLSIDPSGRGKDETAWCVTYMLHGTVYLMDQGGMRQGYNAKTLQGLADIAKKYKVNHILSESNFGDGMFLELLKPYLKATYPCSMEEVRHSKQKEMRIIDTLEPLMNQHRLVVNTRLFEQDIQSTIDLPFDTAQTYQLFYQMSRMCRDRGALAHDDRIDNLAMAVGYWLDHLGQSPDAQAKDAHDEAIMLEVEQFLSDQFGSAQSEGHNWMDARL